MPDTVPAGLARRVRLVAFDVDGVLTDGGIYIGQTEDGRGVELKRFDVPDGLGLKMLVWAGLDVVLVSGRESQATSLRAAELDLPCLQVADGYKLALFRELLEEKGFAWEEAAFLGDDLPDVPILRRVGLPAAVANAVPEARALARWTGVVPGGRGAVREFAEALLRARGEWDALVVEYCRKRGDDAI